VVGGLNRYVRNPMYLAVIAIIIGQSFILSQPVLLVYGAAAFAAMATFTRWYEEPFLERRFGAQYDAYRCRVPRWVPRPGRRHVRARKQAGA
jgi:protein-S-isoprenylcysteine O-methyltransferase Ste14